MVEGVGEIGKNDFKDCLQSSKIRSEFLKLQIVLLTSFKMECYVLHWKPLREDMKL